MSQKAASRGHAPGPQPFEHTGCVWSPCLTPSHLLTPNPRFYPPQWSKATLPELTAAGLGTSPTWWTLHVYANCTPTQGPLEQRMLGSPTGYLEDPLPCSRAPLSPIPFPRQQPQKSSDRRHSWRLLRDLICPGCKSGLSRKCIWRKHVTS